MPIRIRLSSDVPLMGCSSAPLAQPGSRSSCCRQDRVLTTPMHSACGIAVCTVNSRSWDSRGRVMAVVTQCKHSTMLSVSIPTEWAKSDALGWAYLPWSALLQAMVPLHTADRVRQRSTCRAFTVHQRSTSVTQSNLTLRPLKASMPPSQVDALCTRTAY